MKFKKMIGKWLHRYFSEPEAVFLTVFVVVVLILITTMGSILVPIIASIVIAFFLNGFVVWLEKHCISHTLAVIVIYFAALGIFIVSLVWLIPIILQQLINLFNDTPILLIKSRALLANLQQQHPDLFSTEQLGYLYTEISQYLTRIGQFILTFSLASISNVIAIVVYLILVPLMVFFLLKDKTRIIFWLTKFLPKKHEMISDIWHEIDSKIGAYIRGKLLEIIIVIVFSVVVFSLLKVNYALLQSVLLGLSAIIPYIGAILVVIPAFFIAYYQWGFDSHFLYFMITFLGILMADGNILVPLLFSEKLRLHPVAIIFSLLIFGSIWGFWGVFFAIPLATVINSLLIKWPRDDREDED
jgi:putative permease